MHPVVVIGTSGALAALAVASRRYAFSWGASRQDVRAPWPGDELSPLSGSVATRTILIDAPAKAVWGYVAQVGQDRAGFYSYRWLENLFGCDMPNVEEVVPEWQHPTLGDNVWLARHDRYRGQARQKIVRVDDGCVLAMASPEDWGRIVMRERALGGSWTFIVTPVGDHQARLIVRSRGPEQSGLLATIVRTLVFDPAHFIMERRMMRRIKGLAERRVS